MCSIVPCKVSVVGPLVFLGPAQTRDNVNIKTINLVKID